MIYDVVIIGAGASGLYCASHLTDKKILILEKKPRVGLKLLASGSGQCNLTHGGYISTFYDHYGPRKSFVKFALNNHNNKEVVSFFESNGMNCIERPDGKVFPQTLKASDVVETLMRTLKKSTIKLNEEVISVEKMDDTFVIHTEADTYRAIKLVIATGGRSYPTLGTTGDGYKFAESLGHNIVRPKPGLTGVVTRTKVFIELSGISLDSVRITHSPCDKSKQTVYLGDLLFTHFGLSGPVIINNSRYFDKGDSLMLNFLDETFEKSEQNFIEIAKLNGDKPLSFYLNQIKLPDALKGVLVTVDRNTKLSVLTKEQRRELLSNLTQYRVEIESLIGFNQAMVTVGGVFHEEIEPKTMASKIQNGLYLIGEVVDVDGDTGGYNLQWAFSSGALAAQSIQKAFMTN